MKIHKASPMGYPLAVLARAQPYREGETQNHHGVSESTAPNHDLAMEWISLGISLKKKMFLPSDLAWFSAL